MPKIMKKKEQLFSEKANNNYLCCFNNRCSRHAECLHWEVGQYVDTKTGVLTCISPRYLGAVNGACDFFCDNKPITMPVGMLHFYDEMPAKTCRDIKNDLIDHTSRATYYKFHRGDRPITPDMLTLIESVCRRNGWKRPLNFDGETKDYLW